MTGAPPWEAGRNDFSNRPWSQRDDALATDWLQHMGISVGLETTQQAIETVARDNEFHPLRDYLDGLHWDGINRTSNWLALYLGAEDTPYTRAVGEAFLTSAVARIFRPGCKADQVLILEGGQGILKSTAVRTLTEPWFSDEIALLGTKDAAMQTKAVWVIELSELDSLRGPDVSKIKAFVSRTTDRFRPPYGKRIIESPRQCVFIGTTNAAGYLKDATGGRRFWPVRCGSIDLAGLRRDRDQIWAQTVMSFRSGRPWWLTDRTLIEDAAVEQRGRYAGDPWDETIQVFVENLTSTSVDEVLHQALAIPKEQWTQTNATRVSRCLQSFGFARSQVRNEDGRRTWRYVRHH
ncbi:virulence-associated E family protein [Bradyrhizobium sp. AUGA SZCCT0182]|uniref:virulence-associated E family protein n=1 Tax=Bradyrhizobium sp. AUGA SZCCT0182 TaxID=2807667 RepID=UPI001BA7E611|nr:virulence-associated E family protein [Bradyrhizobium sp. AUGA SZCCT0182]